MEPSARYSSCFKFLKGSCPLLLLMFLGFALTISTGYARAQSNLTLDTALRLDINENNRITGNLSLRVSTPPSSSVAIYFVLPFRLEGTVKADRGVFTSYEVYDGAPFGGYTILYVILSPEAINNPQVSFQIRPVIRKSSDFAFASFNSPTNIFNALIIEDRGSSRNTLYLKFAAKSRNAFANLSDLMDSMVVPQEVTINFPPDTILDAIPPSFTPSNIAEGTFPGRQQGNSFTTPIRFYDNQILRINYVLSPLATRPGVIILVTIMVLGAFLPNVLGASDSVLTRRARLSIVTFGFVFEIALFVFALYYEGISYLEENFVLAVGSVIATLFVGIVLLLQVAEPIKQALNRTKGKFHIRP